MNANYNTTTNDDSHHAHEASQFSSRHSLTTNPSSLFRVAAARRGKVLLISLSLSPIFSSIALNLSLSTFSRHLYLHRQTQTQRRGVIIIIILMMLNPSEGQAAQQITSHRPRHTCRGWPTLAADYSTAAVAAAADQTHKHIRLRIHQAHLC